ncbi:ATP-binding protein [bacterium]|nr:ATP-binding protein [bacterium]
MLNKLLEDLINLPQETEWVEFKKNNYNPHQIGKYISALSNSACLHDKDYGYLLFGIEDKTHKVIGTTFKPKEYKMGNEELENWLLRKLQPRVDFKIIEYVCNDIPIVIFKIDPTHNTPTKFNNIAYIRVGTYMKKLSEYPEKERKIWKRIDISVTSGHCFR